MKKLALVLLAAVTVAFVCLSLVGCGKKSAASAEVSQGAESAAAVEKITKDDVAGRHFVTIEGKSYLFIFDADGSGNVSSPSGDVSGSIITYLIEEDGVPFSWEIFDDDTVLVNIPDNGHLVALDYDKSGDEKFSNPRDVPFSDGSWAVNVTDSYIVPFKDDASTDFSFNGKNYHVEVKYDDTDEWGHQWFDVYFDEESLRVEADYYDTLEELYIARTIYGKHYAVIQTEGASGMTTTYLVALKTDSASNKISYAGNVKGSFSDTNDDPRECKIYRRLYYLGTISGYKNYLLTDRGFISTANFYSHDDYLRDFYPFTLKTDAECTLYDVWSQSSKKTKLKKGTKLSLYISIGYSGNLVDAVFVDEYGNLYIFDISHDDSDLYLGGIKAEELLDGILYAG